jgi:hypothetical protein
MSASVAPARFRSESDGFYPHPEPLLRADLIRRAITGQDAVREGRYETSNLTYHDSGPNRTRSPHRSFALHLRTHNSRPVGDPRQVLTAFIDDLEGCPLIYRRHAS